MLCIFDRTANLFAAKLNQLDVNRGPITKVNSRNVTGKKGRPATNVVLGKLRCQSGRLLTRAHQTAANKEEI